MTVCGAAVLVCGGRRVRGRVRVLAAVIVVAIGRLVRMVAVPVVVRGVRVNVAERRVVASVRIHDFEVRRGDARADDRPDAQLVIDAEAAQRATQPVGRETGVEERAEQHVAGGAGEAIQIHHLCHQRSPASFIEQ
jgi:hypothetical protein